MQKNRRKSKMKTDSNNGSMPTAPGNHAGTVDRQKPSLMDVSKLSPYTRKKLAEEAAESSGSKAPFDPFDFDSEDASELNAKLRERFGME